MNVTNQALWQEVREANSGDGYGAAIVEYAERWANLMEARVTEGQTLEAVADQTSHEADTDGITGFMYGMAVTWLSRAWVYGEALRRWHNAEIGSPDAKGTLNPATLSIDADTGAVEVERSPGTLSGSQALKSALGE